MSKITNRRIVSSSGPDFYPTPSWGTEALLDNEEFVGSILEPACGDGSMSVILEKKYGVAKVISSDLYDHGFGQTGVDFLTSNITVDNIITNPPFNLAEEFLETALIKSRRKVALLLRLAFLESVSRYNTIFSKNPPQRVWIFSQRLSMYPKGSTVKGGGTTSYGWFIWDRDPNTSLGTLIKWIPPGYKEKFSLKKDKNEQLSTNTVENQDVQ